MNLEKIASAISTIANVAAKGVESKPAGVMKASFTNSQWKGKLAKSPIATGKPNNTFHLDEHSGAMYRVKQAMLKLAAITGTVLDEDFTPYAANGTIQENKDVKAVSNFLGTASYDSSKNKIVKTADLKSLGMKLKSARPGINNDITKKIVKQDPRTAPTLKYENKSK